MIRLCIHDVASVGSMVYLYSLEWRDGKVLLRQFCSTSIRTVFPNGSMVDVPWRPECRTCWLRLESENAVSGKKVPLAAGQRQSC